MVDLVFICSPYRGDVKRNSAIAKAMCIEAIDRGLVPIAPHLLYPRIVDSGSPDDRQVGLTCAKRVLVACQGMWVYEGCVATSGMRDEISVANLCKIPIEYISLTEAEIFGALGPNSLNQEKNGN